VYVKNTRDNAYDWHYCAGELYVKNTRDNAYDWHYCAGERCLPLQGTRRRLTEWFAGVEQKDNIAVNIFLYLGALRRILAKNACVLY